jgi:hypothetical protein
MTGAIVAPEDGDDRLRDRTPATHGMKFARLLGGHLMPVTLWGDIVRMIPGGASPSSLPYTTSYWDRLTADDNGGRQES